MSVDKTNKHLEISLQATCLDQPGLVYELLPLALFLNQADRKLKMVITNKVFKSEAHTTLRFFLFTSLFLKRIGICFSILMSTTKWACGTKRILYCNANYLRTNVSRLSTCGSGFCFTHNDTINFYFDF